MTTVSPKPSDLGIRTLSALVMVAVSGLALWLGGWAWTLFVAVVAVALLWEWRGLVRGFKTPGLGRFAWNACGFVYIAVAAFARVGPTARTRARRRASTRMVSRPMPAVTPVTKPVLPLRSRPAVTCSAVAKASKDLIPR